MSSCTEFASPVEIYSQSNNPGWSYRDLDLRQRQIAEQIKNGDQGVLLLSEVTPVITYGRRTSESDLKVTPELSERFGIKTYPTDRGGLATYHGPGQWIVFPIRSLASLVGDPKGVRKVVQALLEIALQVGLTYTPDAHIREGCELGVWTNQGKFAAVGIHIEQGILLHGLAVNGYQTPASFQGLKPCGLDRPVDYLLKVPDSGAFENLGNQLVKETFHRLWY